MTLRSVASGKNVEPTQEFSLRAAARCGALLKETQALAHLLLASFSVPP